MKNRAVFLDRDGTVNYDPGYLSSPEELRILPRARSGLKILTEAGFLLFIVTNQSGVGRGYFNLETLHAIHARLENLLRRDGIEFREIAYCPHRPEEGCGCRKPSPLMVERLAREHDVDLSRSFFVGDRIKDVLTGVRAGCRTVLIASPREAEEMSGSPDWVGPDHVAGDLEKAAAWITDTAGRDSSP